VRDLERNEVLAEVRLPSGLNRLVVAPDESRLVAAHSDGALHVLALPALTAEHYVARAHAGSIHGLAFRPDGRLLASGDSAGRVVLRDARTLDALLALPEHDGAINRLAFAPDGGALAVAGVEEDVTVWDLAVLQPALQRLGLDWVPSSTAAIADARTLPAPGSPAAPAPKVVRTEPMPRAKEWQFLVREAEAWARSGHIEEALSDLREARRQGANEPAALLAVARSLGAMGRHEESLAGIREALALSRQREPGARSGNEALALYELGRALRQGGDDAGAMGAFEQSATVYEAHLHGSRTDTYCRLHLGLARLETGRGLERAGRRDDALAALQQARELLSALHTDYPAQTAVLVPLSASELALACLHAASGARDEAEAMLVSARTHLGAQRPSAEERYTLAGIEAAGGALASPEDRTVHDERSLAHLRAAIRAGYRDERQARDDPALASLRECAEFEALLLDMTFPADPFRR
jgi:tetratricopeptide (TPR) repeat protein